VAGVWDEKEIGHHTSVGDSQGSERASLDELIKTTSETIVKNPQARPLGTIPSNSAFLKSNSQRSKRELACHNHHLLTEAMR